LIGDRGTAFDSYGWWDFGRQNTFMENILVQNKINLEPTFIDGYELLLTRPDQHMGTGHKQYGVDCLHYCLPGPPDVLNQVLLHELKRRWETTSNALEN
jgi:hypothetical protein